MHCSRGPVYSSNRFCLSRMGLCQLLFLLFAVAFLLLVVMSFALDMLYAYPICEICMLQRLIMLAVSLCSLMGFCVINRVPNLGYLSLLIVGLLLALGLGFAISHAYMLIDASSDSGQACKMVSQMTFMPDFWYDFFHERYFFVPCDQVKSRFLGLGFPWWALLIYLCATAFYAIVVVLAFCRLSLYESINKLGRSKALRLLQYAFLCMVVVAFCLWLAASVYFISVQRSILYKPNRYNSKHTAIFKQVDQLDYVIGNTKHRAYVYPLGALDQKQSPKNLWIILAGRDTLALDGLSGKRALTYIFDRFRAHESHFLLVDYPGFGMNEGSPSEKLNRDSVLNAYQTWRTRLQLTLKDQVNIYIMAHSMGTGVAADVALSLPEIKGLVLLSPFMSIFQMSRTLIGEWLAWTVRPFLLDRYPTSLRLRLLHDQTPNLPVVIFHGDNDNVIPVSHSHSIIEHNQWIQYFEKPGVSHSRREFLDSGLIKVMQDMMQLDDL